MKSLVLALALAWALSASAAPVTARPNAAKTFYGLSTDIKEVNNVAVGSTFIETNTNNVFRWKGSESQGVAADWVELYDAVTLGTLIWCEDDVNSVCRVEQQFSGSNNKTADTQVKASAGFVHVLECIGTDAVATAGTIILYDNTAESGTIIRSWAVTAIAIPMPVLFSINQVATTGLYLGFTTTVDVTCSVSYR